MTLFASSASSAVILCDTDDFTHTWVELKALLEAVKRCANKDIVVKKFIQILPLHPLLPQLIKDPLSVSPIILASLIGYLLLSRHWPSLQITIASQSLLSYFSHSSVLGTAEGRVLKALSLSLWNNYTCLDAIRSLACSYWYAFLGWIILQWCVWKSLASVRIISREFSTFQLSHWLWPAKSIQNAADGVPSRGLTPAPRVPVGAIKLRWIQYFSHNSWCATT